MKESFKVVLICLGFSWALWNVSMLRSEWTLLSHQGVSISSPANAQSR